MENNIRARQEIQKDICARATIPHHCSIELYKRNGPFKIPKVEGWGIFVLQKVFAVLIVMMDKFSPLHRTNIFRTFCLTQCFYDFFSFRLAPLSPHMHHFPNLD